MKIIKDVAELILRFIPVKYISFFIKKIILYRLLSLDSKDALSLLFDIDNFLYLRQGEAAVRYGDGVHTKHRHIGYHDFFIKRIAPETNVLDIGCGDGALAHSVATNTGAYVTGLDISNKKIAKAKCLFSHPKIEYFEKDATTWQSNKNYEIIILSNVLEHIKPRIKFLKTLLENIEPEKFLIRVPMYDRDWRIPLKKELGVEWRLDSTHEIEYTFKTFQHEIETAHMCIVDSQINWGEIWAEVRNRV